MTKGGKQRREEEKSKHFEGRKNYNKFHLVIRAKTGKEIVANFGLMKKPSKDEQNKSFYLIFNRDRLPYTPTFIQQNVNRKLSAEECQAQFQRKIRRTDIKPPEQMKMPRPRGTGTHYCGVCGTHFIEDYLIHIVNPEHVRKRDEDKYQKMILKLEKFYQRKKQKRWAKLEAGGIQPDSLSKGESERIESTKNEKKQTN